MQKKRTSIKPLLAIKNGSRLFLQLKKLHSMNDILNKDFQKMESKLNELGNNLMAKSKIPDKIKPLATSLTK